MSASFFRIWVWSFLSMIANALSASASGPGLEILNPKEYVSPSGEYRIHIDPSERYGGGKANYRLTKKGVEVWKGERPFTLWDAAVADDGTVAGYAYSHGLSIIRDNSEFRVIILDPTGAPKLEQVTKREWSRFLHAPGNPLGEGLLLDPANDRLVVRVDDADLNRGAESWWVYRLSTGKRDGTFEPKLLMAKKDETFHLYSARLVPGTPLTLLHWWHYQRDTSKAGARFTLIDLKGQPVWSLDLPSDYSRPNDEAAEDKLRNEIRTAGAILGVTAESQFTVRYAKEKQQVSFAVRRGAEGKWDVKEAARKPHVEPAVEIAKPKPIPALEFKHLGSVKLQSPRKKSPGVVRDVQEFAIDGKGQIGFLRRERETGGMSFVLVSASGTLVREWPLKQLKEKLEARGSTHFAWVGGDRFLLTFSPVGLEAKANAWWIDASSGTLTAVDQFDCPAIDALAGFPDGKFVALATLRFKNTMSTTAYLFDKTGQRSHVFEQGYGNAEHLLFSPKDIAVTTDGLIAVLDVIQRNVKLFDSDGKHKKTVDLKTAWKREPNYPSDLRADANGGWIVGDFNGDPPVIRMKSDGSVLRQFKARYNTGQSDWRMQDVQVSPDSQLWATDGEAIVRLDEAGVVDRVLGTPPDPEQLGVIDSVAVDVRGRIYAADYRTSAVHVFDSEGKHLHVCRPEPTDFPSRPSNLRFSVSDQGDVYVTTLEKPGEFLHFLPGGKRLGFEKMPDASGHRTFSEHWLPIPGGEARWSLGYEQIRLIEKGQIKKTIEREPGRNWLTSIQVGAVNRDGTLAVQSGFSFDSQGRVVIHLYDKSGNPIRTISHHLPGDVFGRFSFEKDRLAFWNGTQVILVSTSNGLIGGFQPSELGKAISMCQPFLRTQNEIWLFDHGETMHKYLMK